MPEAIDKGKNVLIASSENAIRGLMMHLCDIPAELIVGVEIPTGREPLLHPRCRGPRASVLDQVLVLGWLLRAGVPLIYDVRAKCLRLLDDNNGCQDPLERYNFGSNGHLLFQPCVPSYDDPA